MIEHELGPLPEPFRKAEYATSKNTQSVRDGYEVGGYEKSPPLYTEEQMHSYALAEVKRAIIGLETRPGMMHPWEERHVEAMLDRCLEESVGLFIRRSINGVSASMADGPNQIGTIADLLYVVNTGRKIEDRQDIADALRDYIKRRAARRTKG